MDPVISGIATGIAVPLTLYVLLLAGFGIAAMSRKKKRRNRARRVLGLLARAHVRDG